MKTSNCELRITYLKAGLQLLLCILFIVSMANAQDPAPSPAITPEPIRTCVPKIDLTNPLISEEQMLDELRCWRTVGPALQSQNQVQAEQIKTLRELSTTYRERGDFYKEAAQARSGANLLEAERDRIRREQIEEYRGEITHLRSENDKLRSSRDRRTLFGMVGGFAACYATRR